MTERRNATSAKSSRSGGVNISGHARVDVGGDIVGRDKVQAGTTDAGLGQLFARLSGAIDATSQLTPEEQTDLRSASQELRSELGRTPLDLGNLERLKAAISAHGDQLAAATSAIFAYSPVQDALKSAIQRLLGG